MNYNNVVSSLRSLAREELRLKAVNSIRQTLMSLENKLASFTKTHEEMQQNLAKKQAVLNFKLSQIAENDPEREDKQTSIQENLKQYAEAVEADNKEFAEVSQKLAEQVAEVNEQIEAVQKGEFKVCKEELQAVTDRLISEVTLELAKEIAANVQQAA